MGMYSPSGKADGSRSEAIAATNVLAYLSKLSRDDPTPYQHVRLCA